MSSVDTNLPYDFDLLWDVKTLAEVEIIAAGEGHCSSAKPEDLLALFLDLELEVPECLKPCDLIFIHTDGTWSDEKRKGSIRVTKSSFQ